MILFPAIDLYDRKVVRLLKGDYEKMTVYSDDPVKTAKNIESGLLRRIERYALRYQSLTRLKALLACQ